MKNKKLVFGWVVFGWVMYIIINIWWLVPAVFIAEQKNPYISDIASLRLATALINNFLSTVIYGILITLTVLYGVSYLQSRRNRDR